MEELLTNILTNLGIYGPLLASFLIISLCSRIWGISVI